MIILFRSLFIAIHFIFSILVGILISLLRPFHANNVYLTARVLGPLGIKILGVDYEMRNTQILKSSRPCVFISNHQNNMDIFVGASIIPQRTVTLGKSTLLWIPIFGLFYWLSGNYLIRRFNPQKSKDAMLGVTESLKRKNKSVWILPEGTRSRGRGLLPFKKGAFITAIEAGVPIVPVVFSSYHKKMKWNEWQSGKAIAKVLEPIDTKGLTREDAERLTEECFENFKQELELLDNEIKASPRD
jgi:1-acyl-sn-glycerol-3-phosphate acyltransferase